MENVPAMSARLFRHGHRLIIRFRARSPKDPIRQAQLFLCRFPLGDLNTNLCDPLRTFLELCVKVSAEQGQKLA